MISFRLKEVDMQSIPYYWHSFLSKMTIGVRKAYHKRQKKEYDTRSFQKQTLTCLKEIEDYLSFSKAYIMFMQRHNIQIPSSVMGGGGTHFTYGRNYTLVQRKLKDLKGYTPTTEDWVPLSQTIQYRALENKTSYQEYLDRVHLKQNDLTLSNELFNSLKESLKKYGYDTKKSIIVINEKNEILDGLHRASILMFLKGPEYQIQVVLVENNSEKI